MEQNRQSQNGSQIAVLEKEQTENKQEKQLSSREIAAAKLNLFSADVLKDFEYHTSNQKKILQNKDAEKKEQKTITPLVPSAPVVAKPFASVTFEEDVENQSQQQEDITPNSEIVYEENTETLEQTLEEQVEKQQIQAESLFGEIDKIEGSNEEEIEEEIQTYTKPNPKGYSFRLRLCTGVMCLLIALFGGWIIGNAIEIASTSAQIAETEIAKEAYEANLVSYLQKISQLDNWNDNNVNSDSSLLPIEEIIPITPTPLEDPTAYERESNWFDKICNWLSNLFGG